MSIFEEYGAFKTAQVTSFLAGPASFRQLSLISDRYVNPRKGSIITKNQKL